MAAQPDAHKLPSQHRFFDLSDYGRRPALWLTDRLLPTAVTSLQVTWAFIAVGLVAALLLTFANPWANVSAGLLLILKSILDAVDGSLARRRARPSLVGRYLDAVGDFVVNVAVYAAIGWAVARTTGQPAALAWAALVWLVAMLQVSLFNYYYVLARHLLAGDTASRNDERQAEAYPWDNPHHAALLNRLYLLIYGWQDRLCGALDRMALAGRTPTLPSTTLLSVASIFGLGAQLLVISIGAFIGQPFWALHFLLAQSLLLPVLWWLRIRHP